MLEHRFVKQQFRQHFARPHLTHLRLQAEHGPCQCLGCTRRWVRWVWWDVSSTWWRSFSGHPYNCSWSILGMSSVALSSSGVENHNRRLQDCEMVSGCTLTKELHCGFYSLKGWRLVLETEHARRKSNNNTCLSIDLWSNSFESISESLLTHLRLQAEHGPCPCSGCTRRWVRWVWWDVSSIWWRSFSGYRYNCSWSILEMSSVALGSSGVENHNRRLQDCEVVSGCTFTEELHCGFYSLKGWRLVLETEHARRKNNNNTCLRIDLWSNSFDSISQDHI